MNPLFKPGAVKWPRSAIPQRQRGATLAEFVVVGPVAILVILALIQVGMMMVAKQVLNEAAFEAARMGASEHALKQEVQRALERKLLPFYQDSTNNNDTGRLFNASIAAAIDLNLNSIFSGPRLKIERLSPPESAFSDFGLNVTDANGNHLAIPNDNLEYRIYSGVKGSQSGLTIQDANELRIRVVYSYELKVPLMKTVFGSVMCGIDSGVNAFGRGDSGGIASASDCSDYYKRGRVPIVTYATVQMQSDVYQDDAWKN